jgi:hypothetical protein
MCSEVHINHIWEVKDQVGNQQPAQWRGSQSTTRGAHHIASILRAASASSSSSSSAAAAAWEERGDQFKRMLCHQKSEAWKTEGRSVTEAKERVEGKGERCCFTCHVATS